MKFKEALAKILKKPAANDLGSIAQTSVDRSTSAFPISETGQICWKLCHSDLLFAAILQMNFLTAKSSLQEPNQEPLGNEDNKQQKPSSEEPSVLDSLISSDAHCQEGSVENLTASTTESVVLAVPIETASNLPPLATVDIQKDSDVLVNDNKSRIFEMDSEGKLSPPEISPPDSSPEQGLFLGPDHTNPKITDSGDEKEDGEHLSNSGDNASKHHHLSGIPQFMSAATLLALIVISRRNNPHRRS